MTLAPRERVDSVADLIFFNATPADIARAKIKIEDFKRWLVETGQDNNLDTWESYCEMTANDE